MCKCKRPSSVDEHVDHLFNCKLFTAEVIVDMTQLSIHEVHSQYISQHTAQSFSFPRHGDLRTSTGNNGRTPDSLIRGLNGKPLYLDVTIANPTSVTYVNGGSSTNCQG